MKLDARLAVHIARTVLHDPRHVACVHGEQIALHRPVGDDRLDVVGDLVQLPPERVGDHLNRFGEPDVAHGALVHLAPELLEREPGADLLLKRETPLARVLHPVHLDAVHALADGGQGNRQGVHREAGVDAGTENGDLRFARRSIVDALRSRLL